MNMTRILGTLHGIVSGLQLAPEMYKPLVPEKYHPAMHGALALTAFVIWVIQRDYNRDGTPSSVSYDPDKIKLRLPLEEPVPPAVKKT